MIDCEQSNEEQSIQMAVLLQLTQNRRCALAVSAEPLVEEAVVSRVVSADGQHNHIGRVFVEMVFDVKQFKDVQLCKSPKYSASLQLILNPGTMLQVEFSFLAKVEGVGFIGGHMYLVNRAFALVTDRE